MTDRRTLGMTDRRTLGTLDHDPVLPVRVFKVETESGTETTDSAGLVPLLVSLGGQWVRVKWEEVVVGSQEAA